MEDQFAYVDYLKKFLQPGEKSLWFSFAENRAAILRDTKTSKSLAFKIFSNLAKPFAKLKSSSDYSTTFALTNSRGIKLFRYRRPQKDKKTGKVKGDTSLKTFSYEEMQNYEVMKLRNKSLFLFKRNKGQKLKYFIVPDNDLELFKSIIASKGQTNS